MNNYTSPKKSNGLLIAAVIIGILCLLSSSGGIYFMMNSSPAPEPVPEPALEKIKGCTDSPAINYNPDAEVDDGSCEYFKIKSATSDGKDVLLSWTSDDNDSSFYIVEDERRCASETDTKKCIILNDGNNASGQGQNSATINFDLSHKVTVKDFIFELKNFSNSRNAAKARFIIEIGDEIIDTDLRTFWSNWYSDTIADGDRKATFYASKIAGEDELNIENVDKIKLTIQYVPVLENNDWNIHFGNARVII